MGWEGNQFWHEAGIRGKQSSFSPLCPSVSPAGNSPSCLSPLTQLPLRTRWYKRSYGVGWDLPGSGKKLAPHLRAAPEHGGGVGFERPCWAVWEASLVFCVGRVFE